MAQLSRPQQIGILVILALGAVFALFTMVGRSKSTNEPAPAPAPVASAAHSPAATAAQSSSATSAQAEAKAAAAPTAVYHGAAPGVAGLSRAIAKAHGAVAISQQNAAALEHKSTQASSVSSPAATVPAAAPAHVAPAPAPSATVTHTATVTVTGAAKPAANTVGAPSGQRAVEAELKQGKTVVLLFWSHKGTDDVIVHRELQAMVRVHHNPAGAKAAALAHGSKFFGAQFDKTVVVHESPANGVASYGSITRGVQVFGTPTILIVNSKGQTVTLTGLNDAYAIEQAISEARSS
jgi:hypothetical protein